MSDHAAVEGRAASGLEGLIHDGRRLFLAIGKMLEDTPTDEDSHDVAHMLATMGRDVMAEAARVWDRERFR